MDMGRVTGRKLSFIQENLLYIKTTGKKMRGNKFIRPAW
jgi:hypothetical protein